MSRADIKLGIARDDDTTIHKKKKQDDISHEETAETAAVLVKEEEEDASHHHKEQPPPPITKDFLSRKDCWDNNNTICTIISQIQSILEVTIASHQDHRKEDVHASSSSSSPQGSPQKNSNYLPCHYCLYFDDFHTTKFRSSNISSNIHHNNSVSVKKHRTKKEIVRVVGRDADSVVKFLFPYLLARLELIQLLQQAQSQFQCYDLWTSSKNVNSSLLKIRHCNKIITFAPLISYIHSQITSHHNLDNPNTISQIPKLLYKQFLQDTIYLTHLDIQNTINKIQSLVQSSTSIELIITNNDHKSETTSNNTIYQQLLQLFLQSVFQNQGNLVHFLQTFHPSKPKIRSTVPNETPPSLRRSERSRTPHSSQDPDYVYPPLISSSRRKPKKLLVDSPSHKKKRRTHEATKTNMILNGKKNGKKTNTGQTKPITNLKETDTAKTTITPDRTTIDTMTTSQPANPTGHMTKTKNMNHSNDDTIIPTISPKNPKIDCDSPKVVEVITPNSNNISYDNSNNSQQISQPVCQQSKTKSSSSNNSSSKKQNLSELERNNTIISTQLTKPKAIKREDSVETPKLDESFAKDNLDHSVQSKKPPLNTTNNDDNNQNTIKKEEQLNISIHHLAAYSENHLATAPTQSKKNKISNPKIETNNNKKKSNKPTRKVELEQILRNNYRTSQNKSGAVQLFASDFDNCSININEKGRPKRMIKAVVRYDARPSSPSTGKKSWKCGSGFHCPQCQEHLSYDVQQCWNCKVSCRYIPGTGPVILRDRSDVTNSFPFALLKVDPIPQTSKKSTKLHNNTIPAENIYKGKLKEDLVPTSNLEKRKSTDQVSDNEIPKQTKRQKSIITPSRKKQKVNPPSIGSNESNMTSTNKSSIDIKITLKKEEKKNHYDPRECEVCFDFYPDTYIDAHRRKVHSLTTREFACPYCPPYKTFVSKENRLRHIQTQHTGLPWENTDEERGKVKCIIYNCPECDVAVNGFGYLGLKDHLKSTHNIEIGRILKRIQFSCAFCIPKFQKTSSKAPTYETVEDLFAHVEEQHKGCKLVGKRIKTSQNKKTSRISRESSLPKVCIPVKKPEIVVAEKEALLLDKKSQTKQNHGTSLSLETIMNKSWPYNRTIYYDGIQFSTLMEKMNKKLETLQKSIVVKKSREGTFIFHEKRGRIEEEYHSELFSLIKSIRDRNNFADRERIEKINYKQESEEILRVHNYNNRCRKATHAEKEQENLLLRQIRIVNQKQRQKTEECFIKDDICNLCNGEFARFIVTDEEINTANGKILDALPLEIDCINGNQDILNPRFRELSPSLDEISDDEELIDQDSNGKQNLRSNDVKNEFLKINELIHSLNFAQRYNQGLLNTSKW